MALLCSRGDAAPAADLVVVWAPGAKLGPIEAVARDHGAALVDRSPPPVAAANTAQLVQRGIDAYDQVRYEEALAALDQARDQVDRTGAGGLATAQLSDLFLYRGLVRDQQQNPNAAWEEIIAAVVIDPSRVLDPARFPPHAIQLFARAVAAVKERPLAQLTIDAPTGCTVAIDGATSSGAQQLVIGVHRARATCGADREPWSARVELTAAGAKLAVEPRAITPPTDADLLVQARVSGARALVVAEVHDKLATARLIGLDGRERDRRTVALAGDLVPLARAVGELLAPAGVARDHWYQSRWAWAGGAALLAAAVLVPLTAGLTSRSSGTTVTVRPTGLPPW